MSVSRWSLVATIVIIALNVAMDTSAAKDCDSPNILFILTDQHRQDCVGAYGNAEIRTPHIDGMATDGVRFDRCYAAQPVCSPNRSSIITGFYPHTTGVWENCKSGWVEKVGLPKKVKTLAEILAPRGYDCGYFGKWHLGRRDAFTTMPMYPGDGRGDNHYFGKGEEKRYGVDVITEDAVAFIKKSRSKPFYLYVSFYPPHPPYSVPAEYEARYQHIKNRNKRIYYAMCEKVDEKVGELLEVLDSVGKADNTLVIFTTDHGHYFDHRWNNHNKRLCYDIASRLPLVMRMPGTLPKGTVAPGLISSVDLVPTMLKLIGQPVPEGLEGQNLSDLATGKCGTGRDFVFIENIPYPFNREKGEERCVMNKRHKLVLSTVRPPELIDLDEDPKEINNIYDDPKAEEIKRTLLAELDRWAKRTNDKLAPKLIDTARKK